MKNGILMGVLFILIGIIFLLNNLNVLDVSLIEIVKVYWPVILIWLGVDKLLRSK